MVSLSDNMSAVEANPAVQKKFGKQTRSVPHHTERASKFYSSHDEKAKRKVCMTGS